MRRAIWNTAFALPFPPLPSAVPVYRYRQSLAKLAALIAEEVPDDYRIELIAKLLEELELNSSLEHGNSFGFTVLITVVIDSVSGKMIQNLKAALKKVATLVSALSYLLKDNCF
jgi:hypothetical protein